MSPSKFLLCTVAHFQDDPFCAVYTCSAVLHTVCMTFFCLLFYFFLFCSHSVTFVACPYFVRMCVYLCVLRFDIFDTVAFVFLCFGCHRHNDWCAMLCYLVFFLGFTVRGNLLCVFERHPTGDRVR